MKPNELSIGNYIEVLNPETGKWSFEKVKGKTLMNMEEVPDHWLIKENIKPIPLNREWKDRLGFNKDCSLYVPNADGTPSHLYFYWLDEHEQAILTFGNGDIEIAQCDWVHEIQNAWFSLTREELKIIEQ